jgi:hypothetical protein
MSVDVEIYMNNVIKFFRENPKDLLNLITKDKEIEFYNKIREVDLKNLEKGEDVALTQLQVIEVCSEINVPSVTKFDVDHSHLFLRTNFGYMCLN